MVMGEDRDARGQGVTKVLRAELPTVRLMEEGSGASIWDVLKVPREGRTTA